MTLPVLHCYPPVYMCEPAAMRQGLGTWMGKLPAAVSPDSMTQSVPSSTALATSVASARVGRGFFIMLSSICVAVITGLPAYEQGRVARCRL